MKNSSKQKYSSPVAELMEIRMEMNCMSPGFTTQILILDGGSEEYDDWD